MQDTALVRAHGGKREGAASGADLFDRDFSHHVELSVAGGFEALRVEVDQVVLFGLKAKNLCGEVLDGVEEFAVTGEQERSVGTGEVD